MRDLFVIYLGDLCVGARSRNGCDCLEITQTDFLSLSPVWGIWKSRNVRAFPAWSAAVRILRTPSAAPFAVLWLLAGSALAQDAPKLRESVHPRRNVEEFAPVEAKIVRFTVLNTTRGEPCLDELEIFGPDAPSRNLALAEYGTLARASGTYPEYRIHALRNVNDGLYGNGHSWISHTVAGGWVELELPAPARIDRVVWSRDREGKFIDRLATEYRIEVATEPGSWQLVASSADRAPLSALPTENPAYLGSIARISPSATDLPGLARPASREYLLETWQTSRGLPANTVTALLQTRDGWLWIGTTNGVARFDGVHFRAFGESDGLPSLSVTCLFEDSRGTLWAGTEGGGLARWDGAFFHALPTGEGRAGNTVLSLAEDAAGTLWVGTFAGLLDYREGKLTRRSDAIVSQMAAHHDGVWLIHGNELKRWDGSALTDAPSGRDPARFSSINTLALGPDGGLWFGGANGYIGRFADDAVTTFGEGHAVLTSSIWELLPTSSGDVWVGTSASGLGRLRGKALLHITTDDGLPANSVRALCEDREGNVWIGTAGGGLTRLSARRVEAITTRDGLSHNGIMALAEDAAGAVWIGTNGGGLNRWQAGKAGPHPTSYVLENKSVAALATAPDGALWLGTSDSGLFHIAGEKVAHLGRSEGLPGETVAALCGDAAGGLWIGTLDGGPAYLAAGGVSFPNGIEALANQAITSIVADRAGRIWFGTAGQGLARLDGGNLTRWTRAEGLASNFVRTLREDAAGAIWIGTSGGLARWKDGRLFTFTTAHGLPDALVSQILDDTAGHLWLGTNRGILRIPLASLDAVASRKSIVLDLLALGTGDGLPSLECTGGYHPAGLRMSDGRLCFGTVAGLAVIDPQRFASPAEKPPVVIEEIAIGTAPALAPEAAPLTVPADAGRLEFHFTALNFTAPERLRFRYRMNGLEPVWTDAGAARSATYTHLPPGDFHFEVTASSDGLAWTDPPATAALRVLSPWWQKPWAYTLGAAAALGSVAGLVRFFARRRLQRRVRALEQQFALERERTRIARDIHDDLGANLTQIGMLSATGREKRDQPQIVGEHFDAIANTTWELVQSLDAIVWAVNPRHDTLESLARYITRFAGDFCEHSPVRLRLDIPPQLPDATLSSELRHNVFLAAKEALNNALKHAGATEVRIRIAAQPDHFTLRIEDDGRGFTPVPNGDGDGLDNMRRRLAECGGSCEISSAAGRGTSVSFKIPLALSS